MVNCEATSAGLTAQLAAAVVRAEQPVLAKQQSDLASAIVEGRRHQVCPQQHQARPPMERPFELSDLINAA